MKIHNIEIDSFTFAYITALLWSSVDDSGDPLDRNFSANDIAEEGIKRIVVDCAKFIQENQDLINEAIYTGEVICGPDFNEWERAGHDFFLTRNRHGSGYWDGDWPEPYAKKLTDAAHNFGQCDPYAGDGGQIYIN